MSETMGATTQRQAPTPRSIIRLPDVALPMWAAVGLSRVLVLVVGIAAALTSGRYPGWAWFDPSRSTLHLGDVGNLLAATVDRWDALRYLQIAHHGYAGPANSVFYPLYPLLIRATAPITGSYVIAGATISLISFAIAMILLHRLTVEELGIDTANATILLVAFAPLSFFFTAMYTESLFLATSVGAFYAARHGRWKLAGLLAAAATATRVPGILTIAGLLYIWWRSDERPRSALAWLCLSTLPLVAFTLYLDARGYGLLASVQNESLYGHMMGGPIVTIYHAISRTIYWNYQELLGRPAPSGLVTPMPLGLYDLIELVVLGISLAALVGVWRRLPRAYAIYATLAMVVFLWSTEKHLPLMAVDRYILTLFPLWMIAAQWISKRRLLPVALAVEIGALIFYTHQFAIWRFVA